MKLSDINLSTRIHMRSDTDRIVTMINRDPFHLMHGVSVTEFEQNLDEPGRRIRENTFVVEIGEFTLGYFSLSFVEKTTHIAVDRFGTWRRRGIGTEIFKFIF